MDIKIFDGNMLAELSSFLTCKKVWKEFEFSSKEITDTLNSYFNNENKKLYVLFNTDKKIKATLGVLEWTKMPYYTIIDYYCDYEGKISNYKLYNEKLWTHVINSMENRGRHSFFWCIKSYPLANLNKRSKPHLVKIVPILNKYQFNIEAVLENGIASNFEIYNNFFTKKFLGTCYIKRGTLKPEYYKHGEI